MYTGRRVVLVLLLVFAAAVTMVAQNSGAMLYATGKVTLNGAAVTQGSSIFTGDRLVTSDSSLVSLNRSGASVVVNSNSAIEYKQSSIEVIEGTARVSTVNGMSAKAGQIAISPQNQSAKFDVARTNDQVTVSSRDGVVAIDDNGHAVVLQPGQQATFSLSDSSSVASSPAGKSTPTSKLLGGGPLYTIAVQPDELPICSNLETCIRPSVSQIRPCRCKP